MAHYAHDDNNNRIETLSKEEVYALLAAAIQQGQLPSVDEDTAFVTMIKSIVDGKAYKIGFCTQAQYNELAAQGLLEADALYVITDDETYDDIETALTNLNAGVTSLQEALNVLQEALTNAETAIVDLQERVGALEANHLYRHDIEIQGAGTGSQNYKTYHIYFTIYCNQSTSLNINDIVNNIGSLNSIFASGYVAESLQSTTKYYPVTRIRASYFENDNFTKKIDIFYLKTEDNIESAVNDITSTISDIIFQIF